MGGRKLRQPHQWMFLDYLDRVYAPPPRQSRRGLILPVPPSVETVAERYKEDKQERERRIKILEKIVAADLKAQRERQKIAKARQERIRVSRRGVAWIKHQARQAARRREFDLQPPIFPIQSSSRQPNDSTGERDDDRR